MIPFNKPYMCGQELPNIRDAHTNGHLSGDGPFTKQCHVWLEREVGVQKALLTHSCTAALEMSALLLDIQPGDEVIMPSYTFVSTANAFALRGATIRFVDIRRDTLNIDETMIEQQITSRTKAICVVHYAGVSCEMDRILEIAKRHDLKVIEDAAQGVMSSYKGRPLGSIGDLGAFSFHETKNVISGEGGALLCRDAAFGERAEIIREKGTNRARFFRGQTDKYTWVDIGSSYLPGEITAAFLSAQLDHAREITERRLAIWNTYHSFFESIEQRGLVQRPTIPEECQHNAHMYYLILPTLELRSKFIDSMKARGVQTVFHYIPLHSSPAGERFSDRTHLPATDSMSERLVRLPLWLGVEDQLDYICESAEQSLIQAS
jgi:dTDP-4-amino-4,6-dideoxygalactose transaminase